MADGAHAFGASVGDKMIGNIADFTTFSLLGNKSFTGIGNKKVA